MATELCIYCDGDGMDFEIPDAQCTACNGYGTIDRARYCGTCNEPEFSEYAVNCRAHTDDNMIEA